MIIRRSTPLPLLLLSMCLGGCGGSTAQHPAPVTTPTGTATTATAAASTTPTTPPRPPPPWGDATKLGGFIDAYVGELGKSWGQGWTPSGYLVVAQDGAPVLTRSWGVYNGDTRFRVGSITKQFTAAAVLQLVEHGQLSVDDPLKKYFPDWPKAGEKVMLRHLLSHTSGIPSYTDDPKMMADRGKPHTHDEVVATVRDLPLHFEPGERFEYSNTNFFLLGMIVEKVSGQKYEDYVASHVFGPARMAHTTAGETPGAPSDAVGYHVDADEQIVPAPAIDMSVPFAAGEVRSTANDLVLWDAALRSGAVISAASLARMNTPVKDGYAFGVGILDEHGHTVVWHDGGIDGFNASLYRVPDLGLVVACLSNKDTFSAIRLGRHIMQMALKGEPVPPPKEAEIVPFPPAMLASLAGSVALDAASRKDLESKLPKSVIDDIGEATLEAVDTRLFFKPKGQDKLGLFLSPDGSLFSKRAEIHLAADAARAGKVPAFTLTQEALHARYVRVK